MQRQPPKLFRQRAQILRSRLTLPFFLLDQEKQTVAAGLGVMDVSLEELVAVAGVNLAAIPVVIVCALFARSYVRGVTAAMVEGA